MVVLLWAMCTSSAKCEHNARSASAASARSPSSSAARRNACSLRSRERSAWWASACCCSCSRRTATSASRVAKRSAALSFRSERCRSEDVDEDDCCVRAESLGCRAEADALRGAPDRGEVFFSGRLLGDRGEGRACRGDDPGRGAVCEALLDAFATRESVPLLLGIVSDKFSRGRKG